MLPPRIWPVGNNSSNPFYPGPLLCDFICGTNPEDFKIDTFPQGKYTITITKGRYLESSDPMEVGEDGDLKLSFPATNAGEFLSKNFLLEWDGEELVLGFNCPNAGGTWVVNSLLIERREKGIKIYEEWKKDGW